MRTSLGMLIALVVVNSALGQGLVKIGEAQKRFNVELDLRKFPQDEPAKALQSIAVALNSGQLKYMMAHLADPQFVDQRVAKLAENYRAKQFPGISPELDPDLAKKIVAYEDFLVQVRIHFRDDPSLARDLRKLAIASRTGKLKQQDVLADAVRGIPKGIVKLSAPSVPGREAYFQKINDRWYLLNRQVEQ
ncbi:MAG: hypothetical protein ACFCD0_26400 [Gemmataceae bacterium]